MKKTLLCLIKILLPCIYVVSCVSCTHDQTATMPGSVPSMDITIVREIELNAAEEIELGVGGTYNLCDEVVLNTGAGANVFYSSASPEIAAVDDGGLVTACGEGKTEITVSAKNDAGEILASIVADVTVAGVPNEMWLEVNELALEVGATASLAISLLPEGLKGEYTFCWVSENEEIVSVTEDGTLGAVSTGGATISVSLDGMPEIAGTCLIKVVPATGEGGTPSGDGVFYRKRNSLPGEAAENPQPEVYGEEWQRELLVLVNAARRGAGLPELKWSASLEESAVIRAGEISEVFSHDRPDGRSCFTVNPLCRGENIAAGQKTPEEVFDSWMNSAGHRGNILNPGFSIMGVGFVYADDDYRYYWAQLFG